MVPNKYPQKKATNGLDPWECMDLIFLLNIFSRFFHSMIQRFTPCKAAEQPLQDMKLQEKETKKD